MKIYLFGNEDHPEDSLAFRALEHVKNMKEIPEEEKAIYDKIKTVIVKPNQDLPFDNGEDVILMDTVAGLPGVRLIEGENLERLVLAPRTSVHDFDLGFQIKYLRKLGKLGDVKIIGLPMQGDIDYSSIHSTVKKLVAQDMQGS